MHIFKKVLSFIGIVAAGMATVGIIKKPDSVYKNKPFTLGLKCKWLKIYDYLFNPTVSLWGPLPPKLQNNTIASHSYTLFATLGTGEQCEIPTV